MTVHKRAQVVSQRGKGCTRARGAGTSPSPVMTYSPAALYT